MRPDQHGRIIGTYSVVRRAPRAEPGRARQKVRLEDRLKHDLHRGLHDPVADRRDRERTPLLATGLRNERPACGKRTPAPVLQIHGQLIEQSAHAVLLDIGDCLLVDAGRATISAHQLPRALQNVPAVDLVVDWFAPRTLPTGADEAGEPPLKLLRDLGQPHEALREGWTRRGQKWSFG